MKATSWTVNLESEPLEIMPTDQQLDDFAEFLFGDRRLRGAAPGANTATRTVSVIGSVDEENPDHAMTAAIIGFLLAGKRAKIPVTIGEASIEVDRGDGIDSHELVSGGDVARRLGLSRERVRQLAEDPARFPRPRAVIGRDRVWRWGDVVKWAKLNDRRAKTPRRTTTQLRAATSATSGRFVIEGHKSRRKAANKASRSK